MVVLAYMVGRRADGRLRRDEGWGVGVRRRVERDIAIVGIVSAISV